MADLPPENQKSRNKLTKEGLSAAQKEFNINLDKTEDYDPSDFSRRILKARDITLIGGPFHYHIRSGTYGDPYDEIPWKVRMGMSKAKDRHGYADNPRACNYGSDVLINNWVEEHRDRNFIKYHMPRLSQYGHYYQSEAMRAYKKPLCNKQRDVLLSIKSFPLSSHPGHQPELNLDTLTYSNPPPESCIEDQQIAECHKEMERQKRNYKASL